MGELINIARADDVPEDRGLTVRVGDRHFALYKLSGRFYVLDGSCPHRAGPLGEGYVEDGSVHCPLHGWKFDIKTGSCSENPDKPAKTYPVRLVDGQLQIEIETEPAV